jgi:hypothetical protein
VCLSTAARFTAVPFSVLRVKTVFTGATGSPYFNQMHFVPNSGTEDVAAANAAITAAKGFWSALVGVIASGTAWTHLATVDQVDPASGALTGQLAATQQTGAGTGTGDQLPQAVQGLVRWSTGFYVNGRQLTGHTYIPALIEGANGAGGTPHSSLTVPAAAAITALVTTPTTTKFVVWHRPKAPAVTGGVVGTVLSGALQPKFAVLRSRRD